MRRRARTVPGLAACLLAAALQGCGSAEEAPPAAARPDPAPAAGTEPPPPEPAPPGDESETAEMGGKSYSIYCASCHGSTGDADTPIAETLDPRPTAHSDGNLMNGLGDDYLFRIIQGGGAAVGKSPLMAAWGGTLSDAQIRGVIAHIRTLAHPPYTGGG